MHHSWKKGCQEKAFIGASVAQLMLLKINYGCQLLKTIYCLLPNRLLELSLLATMPTLETQSKGPLKIHIEHVIKSFLQYLCFSRSF